MTTIFPYGTWIDITNRSTSGDQVSDILASWKQDAFQKMQEIEDRDQQIRNLNETIKALRIIQERIIQVGNHLSMVTDNRDSTHETIIQAIRAWRNLVDPIWRKNAGKSV